MSFWLLILFCLFGSFFFAMAETAFTSVSKPRLKADAERGDARASRALRVTDHLDRAITTILICTNILHLAVAAMVTVLVTQRWGETWVTVSTFVTTLIVFFFAEMLPKSIARKYSERVSLATGGVLSLLMTLLRPFSAFLSMIGNGVSKLSKKEQEASVTEEELYDIIEDMTEEGALKESQGELISSALSFGEVTVESILTSRMDLAAVDVSMNAEEIMQFIRSHNHSRLPVYEGTVDNIVGILPIRRFMKAYLKSNGRVTVRRLLDEPYFVHQSMKIDALLPVMSRRKISIAVVTDNYGGTLGVVTVEDILEELVGEIWDEDDHAVENIVPLSDGSYSINAEEHVLDVFDTLEIDYTEEEEEAFTNKLMSELAYESFDRIPHEGDRFVCLRAEFTILIMKHNRIIRLKARRLPEETGEEVGKE